MGKNMQKTIFVVDDNITNLAKAEESLEKYYLTITLSSAAKMFGILEKITPDLILLDIEMAEMDGLEAMKRLKASDKHSEIPVIFLTGLTDSDTEAYGIALGAVDFITKPFSEPVLLNRIKNHLHIDELIRERTVQLRERTERLEQLQNGLVYILADLVANREVSAGGHVDRIAAYARLLVDAMMAQGVCAGEMRDWSMESVIASARRHRDEGTDVPLHRRIMAIIEVYDALTSERPGKKAYTNKEAVRVIMEDAGQHFDSHIVDVFFKIENQLEAARAKLLANSLPAYNKIV